VENGVLFTLPSSIGNKAFIRTSLDNWANDYHYKINLYNVLYVFIKVDSSVKSFKYRININGYWEDDIYNNNTEDDMFGTKLFIINMPDENKYYDKLPYIENTDSRIKTVTFKYYNPNAYEVNFVCSIDNWSEYSYPMTKDQYGWWTYKKSFTRGKYFYYFLVDGKKNTDINNPNKVWDKKNKFLSFFVIE
jgi:hypothetical protein